MRETARRGALVVGASSVETLAPALEAARRAAEAGRTPLPGAPPEPASLAARERVAIDFADAAELTDRLRRAEKALALGAPAAWKAVRAQGIFRGSGPPGRVAFLYPGQGSQYPNMLRALREAEPLVEATFAEADRALAAVLGGPLSALVFCDPADAQAVARVEDSLRKSAVSQPAVVAADIALTRLLAARGVAPDMVMGHSLGEYAALVAAGALPFADGLEAVTVRGSKLTAAADPGWMAAVTAPLADVRRVLATVEGDVIIANLNSLHQCVIGGASPAVERAIAVFQSAGHEAVRLPVTHAFHTALVAHSIDPLRRVFERLEIEPPKIPVIANLTGEPYPAGRDAIIDLLARHVAGPVDFVKGLRTLYAAGARVFVEVGPKKALQGFAEDVLGDRPDVSVLSTNHPKIEDGVAFHRAVCGLYAAGIGPGGVGRSVEIRGTRGSDFPPVRSLQLTLPPQAGAA